MFVEDLQNIFPAKFGSNWHSTLRGDDFL